MSGQNNSPVGMVLALKADDLGSIPSTLNDPLSISGVIPECRGESKTWELLDVHQKNVPVKVISWRKVVG